MISYIIELPWQWDEQGTYAMHLVWQAEGERRRWKRGDQGLIHL